MFVRILAIKKVNLNADRLNDLANIYWCNTSKNDIQTARKFMTSLFTY